MENNFSSDDNRYRQSRMFPNTTYNNKIEAVLKPALYGPGNYINGRPIDGILQSILSNPFASFFDKIQFSTITHCIF